MHTATPPAGIAAPRQSDLTAKAVVLAGLIVLCVPVWAQAQSFAPQDPNDVFGLAESHRAAVEAANSGLRPIEQEIEMSPAATDRPVSLSRSFDLGDRGQVQVSGGVNPHVGHGNTRFAYRGRPDTWIREMGVNVAMNERETVVAGGLTANLFEAPEMAIGTRLLFGQAYVDDISDRFHFTSDLYYGERIPLGVPGEHWFKAGVFVDQQEDFGKVGPAFGLLLNAQSSTPITFDTAIGFGTGGTQSELDGFDTVLTRAADHDLQFRLGTFLATNWQVGLTTDYVSWDSDRFNDDRWGYGAFTNLTYAGITLQLDISANDDEVRGFANVVLQTDGFGLQRADRRGKGVDGLAWATRPVHRDPSVRVAQARIEGTPPPDAPEEPEEPDTVGNITPTDAIVVFPTRIPFGLGDTNGNGVIDAGEVFEVDFGFTNTSGQVATNVSFGLNSMVVGPATQIGAIGGIVGDVPPGQTIVTDSNQDACIQVSLTAQPGDQIFLQYEVTADGETATFEAGPFIVGQITSGQTVPVQRIN